METTTPRATGGERSIRVFVSSTFRDMIPEREVLTKRVFPELRRICEQRGVAWSEVDLRWGVTDEQAAEGEVLPICLGAIDRCRPFFIGVLGGRYGWIPEDIPQELLEREPWLAGHSGRSVTELEIVHGVLRDPATAEHAYFYIRDAGHETEEATDGAEDRREKLDELKHRIRASGKPVRGPYGTPEELGRLVRDDLAAVIDRLYPPGVEEDPRDAQIRQHEAYALERAAVHVERPKYLSALDAFADDPHREAITVLGESGSGKSALLASWARRRRAGHPEELVLVHFIGISPQSTDLDATLHRLNRELSGWSGVTENEGAADTDALRRELARLLHAAARRGPVVLVLDALNQLEDSDVAHELAWLPLELPEGVHLVASALPGPALQSLERRGWVRDALQVEPLGHEQRASLVERYLAHHSKGLHRSLIQRITAHSQSGNPLHLRTLLDDLRVWGEHETLPSRLAVLLGASSLDELFDLVLTRYESDYEDRRPGLVGDAMALIWGARSGLDESELLDLLGTGDEPLPQAAWAPLYFASGEVLVERGGVIDFAHDFFRQAVAERYVGSSERQRSVHRRLAAYMRGRGPVARALVEAPWQLAEARDWSELADLLADPDWFVPLYSAQESEVRRLWTRIHTESELRATDAYEIPELTGLNAERAGFVVNVAGLFRDFGAPAAAQPLLEGVARWAAEADEPGQLQASLGDLAVIHFDRGRLDRAMELLLEQERICHELDDPRGVARSLGNQGVVQHARGDPDRAMELHREQERICRELVDQAGVAQSLGNQAGIQKERGEPGHAIELLLEQEGIYRELGDPDGLRGSLGQQAAIHRDRGDLDRAMELHVEDERICRELGQLAGLAQALGAQAAVHRGRNDPERALELHLEQERICREVEDPAGLQSALGDQAVIHDEAGDPARAMELYREQERICRELGNPGALQLSLGNQALIHADWGDFDRATELLLEQERICRELENRYGLALSLANQAVVLERRGAGAAGERRRVEALAIAGAAGLSALVQQIGGGSGAGSDRATVHLETAAPTRRPARRRPRPERAESLPDVRHGRWNLFGAKLRRPLAIALPIVFLVLVLLGGGAPAEAAGAGLFVFAIVAYRARKAASRDAREAFFSSYAESRELEDGGEAGLPHGPPLLREGDRRYAQRVMTGTLPGGLRGAIALYVFETREGSGESEHLRSHPFTVVVHRMPEVTERVLELYCEPRSRRGARPGGHALMGMRALQLESVALHQRYEVFFGTADDENWLHQLFSPTFIVWLAEQAPERFAFQLSQGWLCSFIPGHLESAAGLDRLAEAAAVVGHRVIDEVSE